MSKNRVMLCETDELWSLFDAFTTVTTKDTHPNEKCTNRQCASSNIILDGCNYVCGACHTVQGRLLDSSAEWRYFGNEEAGSGGRDPSRCGMPHSDLLPEGSMSTLVGLATSGKHYKDVATISKYQMWNSMPYKERSLYNAVDHLTVKAVNNGISPSIIEEAKVLFKRICEQHSSRGDNRIGILASSIYIACKNNNVPRNAKEIAAIFETKTSTITRNCKKFQEILQLKLACTVPGDFVQRFCSQLDIEQSVRDVCMNIVDKIHENCLMPENSPTSIVAGVLFLVNECMRLEKTKKEIATACGVSEVTIGKVYKKLSLLRDVSAAVAKPTGHPSTSTAPLDA